LASSVGVPIAVNVSAEYVLCEFWRELEPESEAEAESEEEE
jgi:hypothetical protein